MFDPHLDADFIQIQSLKKYGKCYDQTQGKNEDSSFLNMLCIEVDCFG